MPCQQAHVGVQLLTVHHDRGETHARSRNKMPVAVSVISSTWRPRLWQLLLCTD